MAIYNRTEPYTRAQLIAHHLRRNSLFDYIYGVVRLLAIVIQNLYCISSYLVLSWLILLPLSWIKNDLYSAAENYLYNALLYIVSSWSLAAGTTVVEAGEEFKHLIEDQDSESNRSGLDQIDQHPYKNGYIKSQETKMNNHIRTRSANRENGKSNGCLKDGFLKNGCLKDGCPNNGCLKDGSPKNGFLKDGYLKNGFLKNGLDNGDELNFTNNNNLIAVCESKTATNNPIKENPYTLNKIPMLKGNLQVKPKILLLCNHVSTADVPLIMQSFSSLTNQNLLWVLDAQFKPTNFGIVCGSHGDFFIAKNAFKNGALRDHALKYPERNVLVLFPEGGFLRKRIAGSNRYAQKNSLPETRYVTHPRFGAFKDLMDPSVGVTHIVDVTLMYNDINDPPSILDIVLGTRKEPAIMKHKVYNLSEINPSEEWLRNLWLEKDKLLARYYEDREAVYKQLEGTLRRIVLDWFQLLAVHLLYLLVFYLSIFRLFNATSVTMLKARELYYSNI